MNLGITKKLIFFAVLFINFNQTARSAEIYKFDKENNNLFLKKSLQKNSKNNNSSKSLHNNKYEIIPQENNHFNKYPDISLAKSSENRVGLVIQSDKQSEINDVIYAEGNVSVSYRGKHLKAEKLIYDKLNKKISAQGNVLLTLGSQILTVSKLEYSFISEKGYLLDVKGSLNSSTLIDDLFSNFSSSDINKI